MPEKKKQLFIFPYAGGSIAAFKKLTDLIDSSVEVITVEYAGRGTRAKEPLAVSIDALLDDAIDYCCRCRNEKVPYAVMGYSMGSILAYEMLSRKALASEPSHFFISAEVSPKDRALELRKVENPSEEKILERARSLGGFDERLLTNTRFSDIYIKPMISDYRLFFNYQFADTHEKLHVDTTYFYCEKDTALKDICKWDELIEGQFDYHEFGDNHFFINRYYAEMAEIINKVLTKIEVDE